MIRAFSKPNHQRGKRSKLTQSATGIFVAIACLLALGCNDRGYPMTEVSGTVSFNGSPPPRPGRIAFSLVPGTGREGLPYRPGSATFTEDGEFAATTFEEGDGLLPGTYRVKIICISGLPGQTKSMKDVSLVPVGWAPDDLVITGEEGSIELDYNVPPKK